jgi:hypothetical protein
MTDRKFYVVVGTALGLFVLFVMARSSETRQAAAQPAKVEAQRSEQPVRRLIKCEDREQDENSIPGIEMMKRAIPVATAKLAAGDVPLEIRERLIKAIARAEATLSKYRAENPCL